jgi:hypothetical protein
MSDMALPIEPDELDTDDAELRELDEEQMSCPPIAS